MGTRPNFLRIGDSLSFHTMQADIYREELETAWLRGYAWGTQSIYKGSDEACQEAADYAERVVGGSTRPRRPATLCAPPTHENSSQEG